MLDPFCGSGTTTVEALKAGRNAISVDLSPVACYLTRVKSRLLTQRRISLAPLYELLGELEVLRRTDPNSPQLFDQLEEGASLNSVMVPNLEEKAPWFHPDTLQQLAYIHSRVSRLSGGLCRDAANVIFLGILMSSTGYPGGRSYTYYADNVKPRKELVYKDALKLYSTKLSKFLSEYRLHPLAENGRVSSRVFTCDSRRLLTVVKERCDLIVTSPPYLGIADYLTGFRLAYQWFDLVEDLDHLKRSEIGARYRRHTKKNTKLATYKEDFDAVSEQMVNALKSRGYLCLVLGEPKQYYASVREHIVEQFQTAYDLSLQDSFAREISKKFFLHPSGGVPTEEILVFQKR